MFWPNNFLSSVVTTEEQGFIADTFSIGLVGPFELKLNLAIGGESDE